MTEPWENEGHEDETGKGLRTQLEAALAKVKEAEAAKSAAEKALGERVLSDTLKELGVKPSLGKWIQKDGVDPKNQDAVMSWIKDNATDFGITLGGESPTPTPSADTPTPAAETPVNDEFRREFERIEQDRNLAQTATDDKLTLAERGLEANATPEEVYAAFRAAGL